MDNAALEALKSMQYILPKDAGTVVIPPAVEKKLKKVLIAYLEHELQKPLRSSKFI